MNNMDAKNLVNFSNVNRILTVVRSGQGARHIWAMMEEVYINVFIHPLAFFDENAKCLHQ